MSRDRVKPQILVVDDDPHMLKLLRFLLEDEGYEVITASSARSAHQILCSPTGLINLLILDVMMREMDGFEFCEQLRQQGETLPIIFLSTRREPEARTKGLEIGANAYITKPFDPRELFAHMAEFLRRAPSRSCIESMLRLGDLELDASKLRVKVAGGKETRLTRTETKLLHYLMSNPGTVLTRDALVNQVWDYDYDGNNNTVDVYIGRLRRKVEHDPNVPERIRTIHGTGYVFEAV